MKLDEIIKEIQDLKEKERQLEYLKKDKIENGNIRLIGILNKEQFEQMAYKVEE